MKGGRSRGGINGDYHRGGSRGSGNHRRNHYHSNHQASGAHASHPHYHRGPNMGAASVAVDGGVIEIPVPVQQFFRDLASAVRSVRVHEIRHLYDTTFNHLTEQHFKIDISTGLAQQHWPTPSVVASYFEGDVLLMFLYKELYYRYQHQLRDVSEHIRYESWENYSNFFDYVLNARDLKFDLPQSWLWDIMDEFIYQMVTCCLSRKRDSRIWNPSTVINLLERIIERSNVRSLLVEVAAGRLPPTSVTDYGQQHLLRMMGHNAIIMLLRIYTQLGDYYTAMRMLEKYEIRLLTGNERSAVYTVVPACYMTLHYYTGFCCIMLRRYADAYRLLTNSLRCKNYHIMSYQQQVITTLLRHAQSALSIVNMLCPQRMDVAREEEWHSMDEEAFTNTFKKACPKYITPYGDDHSVDVSFKLMQTHCSLLYREVQQQECVPFLRSYLRLYDEITTEKLASLQSDARATSTDDVTRNMLCWKHKAYQLTFVSPPTAQVRKSSTGHGLRGDLRPAMGGIDFSVDGTNVVRCDGSDSYGSNAIGAFVNGAGNAVTQNTVYHLLREFHVVKEMARTLEQAGAIPIPVPAAVAVAANGATEKGVTPPGQVAPTTVC